jgi:hypothetical protein
MQTIEYRSFQIELLKTYDQSVGTWKGDYHKIRIGAVRFQFSSKK